MPTTKTKPPSVNQPTARTHQVLECASPFVACIEVHPWLSPWHCPDRPTAAVFDLDPNPPAGFIQAREVALLLYRVLQSLGLKGYPKTSGAGGLHIYIPAGNLYTYSQVRHALTQVAQSLVQARPDLCTLERRVSRRGPKVYIDVSRNGRGKTIASVYSVRPLPGAPVSTPVTWEELADPSFDPAAFNLFTMPARLASLGDLFAPVLRETQCLEKLL